MFREYKIIQQQQKFGMLASRLQQALIKRIEFIENLLLIYSYSQILTIKIPQYQVENQQMYQKEMMIVEAFRNIFRIDSSFRKFYYKTCMNIFARLDSKVKKSHPKNIARIHNVYFQFLIFFKGINELAIARYLCEMNFEALSENQLFIKLTHTLIKYLKIKTQAMIEKLKEKIGRGQSKLKQREDNDIIKKQIYEDIERKDTMQRKRFNNFLRRSSLTQVISKRKYNSEENPKKWTQSIRKMSNELYFTNQLLNQSKQFDRTKGISNIDWKIRFKKFQEYYASEWQNFYHLTGLEGQIEQLKFKGKKIDEMSKKQWIYENYRFLFQEMLSRHQEATNSYTFYKEVQNRSPLA